MTTDSPFLRDMITPYQSWLHHFSRRKHLIKMMVAGNVLILLFVHLYLVDAYPLSVRSPNTFFLKASDVDSIHSGRSTLEDLVNSFENKNLFSQLQHSNNSFFDSSLNTVGTIEFPQYNQYQRQPYVSNGYIGSRIPNLGQGFTYDQLTDAADANEEELLNGWPLFNKRYAGAFIAGFYDAQPNTTGTNFPELLANGYESVIASVPQWTTLELSTKVDGKTYALNPAQPSKIGEITNYVQNLSLSDGIVTTEFTWLDKFHLKVEVVAHRERINNGIVDLQIVNLDDNPRTLLVEDKLDFATAHRAQLTATGHDDDGIFIQFQPLNVDYVNGAIYSKILAEGDIERNSTDEVASQTVSFSIKPKSSFQVSKIVGIVSSDLDPKAYNTTASVLSKAKHSVADVDSAAKLVDSHIDSWAKTLRSALAVTFADDDLLTLASRASIYHLTANTRPDAEGVTAALSVVGLSSDSYGGMVFWDTDLWMLNGLLPFVPDHGRSIINYRLHTHEQARKNLPEGYSGAVYPWTSGRFGNCTGTGPCMDYEYHINFDIAKAAWDLYLSGAVGDEYLESIAYPLINDAALFFSYYVTYNDTFGKFTSKNLTDPDEYANHVDNGAFTNAAISLTMKWAIALANHLKKEVPASFTKIAGNMFLPASNNSDSITLEYSGMNTSVGIKQADVIMVTYPLENELITEEQAQSNMEFYSMKQVSYGPAMTFPIFSVVANTLSPSGCASYSYLKKAVQPFLRAPFAQFSEQNNDNFLTNGGTHPAFPFMTAHGGFLQSVFQGLTGFRYDFTVGEGNKIMRVARFDPVSVPCIPNGVIFDGLMYLNHSLSLTLNENEFTIVNHGPLNNDKSDVDDLTIVIGERNSKSGTYTLKINDSLTVPTFKTSISNTGSIAECNSAVFTNITESSYGDSSFLMNDGDNTTHWQSRFNDTTAKVLVDLNQYQNITNGWINWGDKPPKHWSFSVFDSEMAAKHPDLTSSVDFLSDVNFGNGLSKYYTYNNQDGTSIEQSDVFTSIIDEDVDISAPFDSEEYSIVQVPSRYNVTAFELEEAVFARFVLIEINGTHDTVPIDGNTGGGKIFEVALY